MSGISNLRTLGSDGIHADPTQSVMMWSDGSIMRRVIAIAAAGISLAGCSSTPDYLTLDYYKSKPVPVQIQLESTPSGAEAKTSLGQSCKTPCSVSVTPPEGGFTVSYTMARFQPVTVPVRVIRTEGSMLASDTFKVEPNPVVTELQPAGPAPKAHEPAMRPKRKKPGDTAAAPGSAFPDPGQAAATSPR